MHTALPKGLSPSQADYFNRPGPWDDKNLDSLLHANKVWSERMVVQNPNYFEDQKKGTNNVIVCKLH